MVQDAYISLYKEQSELIDSYSSDLLNTNRAAACESLSKLGLSIYAQEYERDFGLNINRYRINVDPYLSFKCDVPNIGAYIYVVLNDTFYPNSQQAKLPEGVIVCGISEAISKYSDLVKPYINRQMAINTDGNQAFNAMFAQDGLFVYIPKGLKMDKPLQLINLMHGNSDILAVSHNLIILEEDSSAQLLICDHASGDSHYLTNRVTEVFVGKNAVYEHYKLENTHEKMTNICSLLLSQADNSQVLSNIITLHNNKTRNTVVANINGSHSSLSLNGLVLGDKDQNIDNTTTINHIGPDSSSTELFKYVLDGQAKGKFYGMVKVYPNAQKTSAIQTNRNMCISNKANMQTKPQLEIYADDVKCNHGATVGQLDENALFYLRSRGISEQESRMLLMYAFVHDVLENIRLDALKDRLKLLIEKRLRGELSKCNGCVICK